VTSVVALMDGPRGEVAGDELAATAAD